jgi:hypothetical protein
MINKENPLNKQGKPCIIFANSNPDYKTPKPGKKSKHKTNVRRQVEDIQHAKEFEKLWGNL